MTLLIEAAGRKDKNAVLTLSRVAEDSDLKTIVAAELGKVREFLMTLNTSSVRYVQQQDMQGWRRSVTQSLSLPSLPPCAGSAGHQAQQKQLTNPPLPSPIPSSSALSL